jgi:hypothetical protein
MMRTEQLGAGNSTRSLKTSTATPSLRDLRVRATSQIGFLLTLVLLSFCLLQGCGGGSQATPPTPPPVNPGTATIVAPASGATVTAAPMAITLDLLNGATLAGITVTLDGADITSQFAAGTGGTATARVTSSHIYIGNNRIQVVVGTGTGAQTVKSQFTYDPSLAGGSPGTPASPPGLLGSSSSTLPDVISIQTRVRTTNSNGAPAWGIQVGQTTYADPNANTDGFQVVLLKRSDLSQVYNNSFQLTSDQDVMTFDSAVAPGSLQGACGFSGCLEIVQSLNTIGYDPCPGGAICFNYYLTFAQLGGTTLLQLPANDLPNLAYSLIGNVGSTILHAGSSFERITCASSDGCIEPEFTQNSINNPTLLNGFAPNGMDGVLPNLANTGSSGTTNLPATTTMPALTVSNNGAMAGELILDNTTNYTFAYPNPPINFLTMAVPDDNGNPTGKNLLTLDLPTGSQMTFPGGTTHIGAETATLPANADQSTPGGFHLAVFDSNFNNLANGTYTVNPNSCPALSPTQNYCLSKNGVPIYNLNQLALDIERLNSRGNLFFLASIGNLNHNFTLKDPTTGTQYNQQDVWDRVAQAVQDIGGTYATFVSLNNPAYANDAYDQYTQNTVPKDDYALVGQWWLTASGVPNPYAMEESSQISRQTNKYPVPSNVQGALEVENDGYYQVKLHTEYGGLLPSTAFTLAAAPLVPPVQWPLTGPNDSSGVQAAYAWTSQQLLSCVTNCTNIRTAYTNLNQSPAIWLDLLSSLEIPEDCSTANPSCTLNFDASDFDIVRSQLLTELQYVGAVREYENNVVGLLLAEQANVSVILQQTADEVLGNISYGNNSSPSYGVSNWRTDVDDSLSIIGPLGGAALTAAGQPELALPLTTAIGITHFALDASAKHTNDSNGRSLIEQAHDLLAAGALAQTAANQYAATLTSVGGDFIRIASDWGRLQMVGQPIVTNGFSWDPQVSGYLLTSFDTSIRRSFYKSLMAGDGTLSSPNGYRILHFTYSSPGLNPPFYNPGSAGCSFYGDLPGLLTSNPDSYAYLPGALFDGPGASIGPNSLNYLNSLSTGNLYPFDLWWDVWAMQDKSKTIDCVTDDTAELPSTAFFNATGLFRPLDPADPNPLGLYKPWFYQRSGIPVDNGIVGTKNTFWYQHSQGNGLPPYFGNGSNFNPDPDNY